MKSILWFHEISLQDLPEVGGKNSSLGEMTQVLGKLNILVPPGFATTSSMFHEFLNHNHLTQKIYARLNSMKSDDINELQRESEVIRELILAGEFSDSMIADVKAAFTELQNGNEFSVAVRSSATVEDLPTASFAGQQETYLNINGFDNVMQAIKNVYASLFTARAISYRNHQGFPHDKVALSVGVQKMVQSDKASSGVMFSIDTESGFDEVVFITAAYGLGESVVQGSVNPDEFYVYKKTLAAKRPAVIRRNLGSKKQKMIYGEGNSVRDAVLTVPVSEEEQRLFCITSAEVEALAAMAVRIEEHYGRPMDIEWAKDGVDNKLYIVQARPETVQSQKQNNANQIERFELKQKGRVLVEGRSIGQKIGQGTARILTSLNDMDSLKPGDVLVTDMTDPDWEPIMKRASAIVTNRGGRTCHAAIIARELGIPACVGTGHGTEQIKNNSPVTVSCAEGETGFVYEGILPFNHVMLDVKNMPELPLKVMLNVGNPDRAFQFASVPNEGVGLARLEFIISNMIGIHPRAILELPTMPADLQQQIKLKTASYDSPKEYYVGRLAEGIATIAASFYPKPVIVRMSDFKSNEYANLLGGQHFEPDEENPMLGFRGASRYFSTEFKDCFALECIAVKRVREEMGFTNVEVMIPFVRTLTEANAVVDVLAANGLKRGEAELRLIMMCEIPSNALLAEEFLQYFDGFSIGSNDLTQLTLGLDRDSSLVASAFDERDPAIKKLLSMAIKTCNAQGKYVGICGQGPSDHPDFALWLLEQGIQSVSLNPDTVIATMLFLANKG